MIGKLECTGHIQKHLGCCLCTLQQTCKGKRLSDSKRILGNDGLADRAINLLQNNFGMAIRLKSDVQYMKIGIGAVLFHF